MRAWQTDAEFRRQFNQWIADSTFDALRWETPSVSRESLHRSFEFVLLDSPGLARNPDSSAFAEQFASSAEVVEFANLGRDAVLIVPCPRGPATTYGHLASFVRHAPDSQRDALWQQVGVALERRVGNKAVWLSTAGAGVSWLHIRLDDRPKYYSYAPYRAASP